MGPDGNVWGFGLDTEHPKDDYNVIERYSMQGVRLSSEVKKSSFNVKFDPARPFGLYGDSFLRASPTRVGAFSPAAQQWLEFDSVGALSGRWTVPLPKESLSASRNMRLDFLVMTQANDVYGWLNGESTSGIYKLDRAKSTWISAPMDPTLSQYRGLYGIDGSDFVMARQIGPLRHFVWVAIPLSIPASSASMR